MNKAVKLMIVILGINVLIIGIMLAFYFTMTKVGAYTDQPLTRYTSTDLSLTRNGIRISGVAFIPETESQSVPLVICSHAIGGNYANNTDYAKAFASHGIAAFTFDYSGGGGTRSEGSILDMSILTEVEDLEAVLEAAKSWDFVNPDQIILLGCSQGGVVSAITAARHPEEVHGLILCDPLFSAGDIVHQTFTSPADIPDQWEICGVSVGKRYAEDIWDYDLYSELGAYSGKVLILHGDSDQIMDQSYSQRARDAFPDAELQIINGGGHLYLGDSMTQALKSIFAYLEQ